MFSRIVLLLPVLLTSCTKTPPSAGADGGSAPTGAAAGPTAAGSAAPSGGAAVPTPSGGAAAGKIPEGCLGSAQSVEYAKPHRQAEPPFEICAAGVFAHCGGKPGERGHLCSRPLDKAKTTAARKQNPDSCCYHPAD